MPVSIAVPAVLGIAQLEWALERESTTVASLTHPGSRFNTSNRSLSPRQLETDMRRCGLPPVRPPHTAREKFPACTPAPRRND
ncbi:hypothetical protein BD309DRAFT_949785 [Dichomitus squalens]|nr:hypothetical protein BD309DRAFT_949785 [Dichomitus squalens]